MASGMRFKSSEGEYCLDAMRGTYKFVPSADGDCKGDLTTADDGTVGTFKWEPVKKGGGSLQIPEGKEDLPCIAVCESEIMAEIQKETSQGAFFVLPSQLNGAEYPSCEDQAIVKTLEEYKYDNTGGPRGQLACHPAAAQFVIDNASSSKNPCGINAVDTLLQHEQCKDLFVLQNGYLRLPEDGDDRAVEAFKSQLGSLRVLAMLDVPANGLKPSKRELNTDARHKVSLVYASAIPVDSYLNRIRPGMAKEVREFQTTVAELELVAQYYGAMQLAAREYKGQRTQVFLMPLGGGVFCNPWPSIVKAMCLAAEMLTPQEREKLDIKALAWSGNPAEAEQLRVLLRDFRKLAE